MSSRRYTMPARYATLEDFSFLGTIQGGYRSYQPTDQCFCQDAALRTTQTPEGRCFPEQRCGDCNLDRSGECPQYATDPVPGV